MARTSALLPSAVLALALMTMMNSIQEVDSGEACPTKIISKTEGEITSHNYPYVYRKNTHCSSTITAPVGAKIKIVADSIFDLEPDCSFDSLKIYDGSKYIGSYCGKTRPDSFTSDSNKVLLVFQTDRLGQFRGFKISYKIINTCRFVMDGQDGIVNFSPDTFEETSDTACYWILSAPIGQFVRLDLKTLYQRVSEDRRAESIEVFDIMHNGYLISRGKWTTNETSPPNYLTSFSSEMKVSIRRYSDPSTQRSSGASWRAQDESHRGGETFHETLTGRNIFNEPNGFLELLCYDRRCQFEFTVPPKHQKTFTFTNLQKGACDAIEVWVRREVYFEQNDNIFCDDTVSNQTEYTLFANSILRLQLYWPNEMDLDKDPIIVSWTSECRTKLTQPGEIFGEISYSPNLDCEWELEGDEHNTLTLSFNLEFDIESSRDGNCTNDYIEVFDILPGDQLASLGRFCGISKPPQIKSSRNKMIVRFHTDDSKEGKGFNAFWDQSCGGIYTSPEGTIQSPGYPSNYPDNLRCQFEIRVPRGHLIQLAFNESFALEDTEHCEGDYLEIFDYLPDDDLTWRGTWCGTNPPPLFQASSTSQMQLMFRSDGAKNYPGFQARWTSGYIPSFECGGVFNSTYGKFYSPGYPQSYPNNMQCRWEIRASNGKRIKLEFDTTLDLELDKKDCRYDGVEVLDTLPNGKMASYGKWCGVRPIPAFYSMTKLVVLFYSDGGKNGQGFSASWDSGTACGATIKGKAGHLATKNYPSPYPVKQECRWLIEAAPGIADHNVTLQFDPRFELEESENCAYDYVEIHRGQELLGRWCGKNPPPDVTSGNQTLLVVFKSDKSVTGKGFLATLE